MLLIVFLGLIPKITLGSGDCDVGTQIVQDFDYHKVLFIVLITLLTQRGFKVTTCVFFVSFVAPLTNSQ
jgi:hypothetical protein